MVVFYFDPPLLREVYNTLMAFIHTYRIDSRWYMIILRSENGSQGPTLDSLTWAYRRIINRHLID
jgi:hypothetical protein